VTDVGIQLPRSCANGEGSTHASFSIFSSHAQGGVELVSGDVGHAPDYPHPDLHHVYRVLALGTGHIGVHAVLYLERSDSCEIPTQLQQLRFVLPPASLWSILASCQSLALL
jgi:hypothetical protein